MAAGAIPPPLFFERAIVLVKSPEPNRLSLFASGERHCQEHPETR
jgi:hypothetical protein